MITSDDLRFFNVLAKSATLAESARKLDVTPPAVTQRLRALEAKISSSPAVAGTSLTVRSPPARRATRGSR